MAEDNAVNQRVAQLILGGLGYDIEIVDNGERALDAVAAAHGRGQPFDVVLLDVQMPVLDGLEATRRLCAQYPDAVQRPWIIAMTANAMQGDREELPGRRHGRLPQQADPRGGRGRRAAAGGGELGGAAPVAGRRLRPGGRTAPPAATPPSPAAPRSAP